MQNQKSNNSGKLLLLCKKDYCKSSLSVNIASEPTILPKPLLSKDSFTGSPSQVHNYTNAILLYKRMVCSNTAGKWHS